MIALFLKDRNGKIVEVFDGIREIARLFQDQTIATLNSGSELPMYLMTHFSRPVINSVSYYHSEEYLDYKGNIIITYTQL